MTPEPPKSEGRIASPPERAAALAAVINSASLFADRKEVHIHHGAEVYRLRVTRNGKLILNK